MHGTNRIFDRLTVGQPEGRVGTVAKCSCVPAVGQTAIHTNEESSRTKLCRAQLPARMLPRQGSRREPFGKFRRYVQYGAVNKCGLRAPLTVSRIQRDQVPKHVERSTSSRRPVSNETRLDFTATRPPV